MDEEFIKSILSGDVILFLGAGFSLGATNAKGEKFKTGNQLNEFLASKLSISKDEIDEMDLHDVADEYIREHGTKEYLRVLREEFVALDTTDVHKKVAQLPWRRVYTTNYDLVFEKAAESVGRRTQSFDLKSKGASIINELLSVIHLNGIIDWCDEGDVADRIKLTFGANLSSLIAGSSCGYVLQEDLAHAKGCVILGYTMPRYDIDITRLFVNESKKSHNFFFSGQLAGRAKRNVELVGVDESKKAEDFLKLISPVQERWNPDDTFHPVSLQRFKPLLRTSHQTGIDSAFRFFALGDASEIDLGDNKSFVLQRRQRELCCALIEEKKAVLLHSFFGNGKTILSQQIGAALSAKSWDVFTLGYDTDGFSDDIDKLVTRNGKTKTLIIIEEFSKHQESVQYILRRLSDNLKILVTDRTTVKETFRLDLETGNLDANTEVADISCDTIESSEISQLVQIFDSFGLWQKKLKPQRFVPLQSPDAAKHAILRDDCKGHFQEILLHIMESPQMRDRLEGLFLPLYRDPELKKVLITLCILILTKISLSSILLNSICGNVIFQRKFSTEDKIHQLIDIKESRIRFRSTITAEYIVNEICDFEYFFECLTDFFWKLDELNGLRQSFHDQLGSLTVFSIIERLIPDKFKPDYAKSDNELYRVNAIIAYLESIKDTNFCSSNKADFYLQLAIAFLAKNDLEHGEAYLNHAQNFAHSSRMKYKVSNQVSRLLLAKATSAPSLAEAWPLFVNGREIIEDQMQTSLEKEVELEYPFARASSYLDFVKRFGNSLSREQLDELLDAVSFVSKRIEELPDYLKHRTRVKKCIRNMTDIRKFFRLA